MAGTDTRRLGTGLQQTVVEPLPDGRTRWSRTPGVDNHDGLRTPPPGLADKVAGLDARHVEFVLPTTSTAELAVWETDGSTSLAEAVQQDPDSALAREGLARLSRAVEDLHAQDADVWEGEEPQPPPGLQRFVEWWETGAGTRAGGPWRVQLRSALGTERWDRLHDAAVAMLDGSSQRRTDLHGWVSLGGVVVADDPDPDDDVPRLQVLTGLDVGRGLPEVDVTCALGELAEFASYARRTDVGAVPYQHLGHIYSSVYAGDLDPELVGLGTAVRVALHSRDFACYVGWHQDLELYPAIVADLLDQVPSG